MSGERSLLRAEYKALVAAILADRPHPEQGYRSCLGLMRLSRRYGTARLEAACGRALAARARSYRHVDSILKHGLEALPLLAPAPSSRPVVGHEHLRGREYYQDPVSLEPSVRDTVGSPPGADPDAQAR